MGFHDAAAFENSAPSIALPASKTAPECTIDFETYSECDLSDCGAWVYAEDPTTEIIFLSYKLPDQPTGLWSPLFGDPFPQALVSFILAGGVLVAHNAGFERAIWRHIIMKRYGVPGCTRWKDTMAVCAYRALPLDLDRASRVLGLSNQKDKRGKFLIQKLCKPQRPTKKQPGGRLFDLDLLREMGFYCMQDTDTEHELGQCIGDLPPSEYKLWVLDQKINDRGVFVDQKVVRAAVKIVEAVEEKLEAELNTITSGRVAKASALPALKAWLADEGYPVADLAADTIEDMLHPSHGVERCCLPAKVQRALQIRQTLSKSSTKKLYKYLSCAASDGCIHGLLQYHAASTGRWAGRLLQPHNFPRGDEGVLASGIEVLIEIIAEGDPELLELIYGDPMEAIASALRGMIVAEEGEELYVADFSAIEARVAAWIAGEDWKVKAFEAFDRGELFEGSADMYCATASRVLNRLIVSKKTHPKERQEVGKVCVGGDTPVLTDNGVKDIIAVTKADRVWDGYAWVSHDGLLNQGEKQTIHLMGVDITPDHEIYLSRKISKPASEVASQESMRCRALAHASENLPLSVANACPIGLLEKCSEKLTVLKRVYDLANAGPLHRYTILADSGFLQVGNCELALGYQGSIGAWRKFDDSDVWSDEQVLEHVRAWRKRHPMLVRFWYAIEDCAIRAVQTGKPQSYRGIVFELIVDKAGRWLTAKLPSDRRLWYFNPHVIECGRNYEGDIKYQLRYEGRNSKKGGAWSIVETYGGSLFENLVQAISRDIMVEGMIAVESAGYPIILTVHDEVVSKRKKNSGGDFSQFQALMSTEPRWFKGFPLHAEGGTMTRYRK